MGKYVGTKIIFAAIIFFFLPFSVFSQVPSITSVSPLSKNAGAVVTITGTNFSGDALNTKVYFDPVNAPVLSATPSQLSVRVPTGATYGPVLVQSNGKSAISPRPFNHQFPGIGQIDSSTFSFCVQYPSTNYGPSSVLLSDLDGDTLSDLVSTNLFGNSLGLYRCTGPRDTIDEFMLSSEADYSAGFFPKDVGHADFNNDGKLDVVTAPYFSPSISLFRNNSSLGIINFAPKIDVSAAEGAKHIAVGDIDGDGLTDIAICLRESSTVMLYRNICTASTIQLQLSSVFSCSPDPEGICLVDLDGDRKLDIVTTSSTSNSISVMRNFSVEGSFSYGAQIPFNTQRLTSFIISLDGDSDGKYDLLIGSYDLPSLLLVRNISTGGNITFDEPASLSLSGIPLSVAVGDLDGEGKPDIAATTLDSNGIDILKNNSIGAIDFSKVLTLQSAFKSYSISIGDMNGDELPELIVPDVITSTICVYQNFTPKTTEFVTNIGWNLVSVPRIPFDPTPGIVFENAVGSLFDFITGAYTFITALETGKGYWAYYYGIDTVSVVGVPINQTSISIPTGNRWALIGSVTEEIPVSSISTNPPSAIVPGSLFSFNGTSYTIPTMIQPGKGYWVYVYTACTINIGQ